MQSLFPFTPTGSDKADAFLKARADHLARLTPAERRVFIKSALAMARTLPLSADVSAFAKSQVIIALEQWLDTVCAEVAA